MRFSISAIFFIIAAFIFFVIYAVGSRLLQVVADALIPYAPTEADRIITLLQNGFGVIAVLFFIIGIVLIFVLDSFADENEYYYVER